MPTVGDVLAHLNFEKLCGSNEDESSGAGGQIESRSALSGHRSLSTQQNSLHLCEGCHGEGSHECNHRTRVNIFRVVSGRFYRKSRTIPCGCKSCNPK
jgi:hypothetical protein